VRRARSEVAQLRAELACRNRVQGRLAVEVKKADLHLSAAEAHLEAREGAMASLAARVTRLSRVPRWIRWLFGAA
jgi:hypothetical protein